MKRCIGSARELTSLSLPFHEFLQYNRPLEGPFRHLPLDPLQQRVGRSALHKLLELRSVGQDQADPIDEDIDHGPPLLLSHESRLDGELSTSRLVDKGRLDHGAILRDGLSAVDGLPLAQKPEQQAVI